MHAVTSIFDFMKFMSFIIKFKPIMKFKKVELHNCGV